MDELNEGGLARAYQHSTTRETAHISAERGDLSKKENRKRSKELEKDLRDRGYGFKKTEGQWIENQGEEDERPVKEKSYMVNTDPGDKSHGKLKKDMRELGAKYNQDATIVKRPDQPARLYGSGKKPMADIGRMHPGRTADMQTKIGKKTFTYEEFRSDLLMFLEENLPDGKYDEGFEAKHSPATIAQKHGVTDEYIEQQLEVGIRVESEHTDDKDIARTIALQHLAEKPDYYTQLKKVEAPVRKNKVVESLIDFTRASLNEDFEPQMCDDHPDFELVPLDEIQVNYNGYCYDVVFRVWGKQRTVSFFIPGPGRPTRKEVERMLHLFYPEASLLLYNLSSVQSKRPMIVVN